MAGVSGLSIRASEDAVYFTVDNDFFYALDLSTGRQLWRHPMSIYNDDVLVPTIADGVVYIGSSQNRLYALQASSGEVLWEYDTDPSLGRNYPIKSSTVLDHIVYFGSENNYAYALDASTGHLLWSYDAGDGIPFSMTVTDGIVYAAPWGANLHALDTDSGQLLWQLRGYSSGGLGPHLVADGIVYGQVEDSFFEDGEFKYGDKHGYLVGLDARTGEFLWDYSAGRWIFDWLTAADGVAYVGSLDGVLSAIDASTGEKIWSFKTEGKVRDSIYNPSTGEYEWKNVPAWVTDPLVVDGVVYFVSRDTNLYAADAKTGQLLFSYATGDQIWGKPRVVEGVVYVGSSDGFVYAIVPARPLIRQ